jgi:hypothetical protein
MNKNKEKQLTDAFRQLLPETQDSIILNVRFSLMAEQAIKRQYGLDQEQPAQRQQEGAA